MEAIEYVGKKNGNAYIIWLQKSNQYIRIKNPAFEIFQFLAKNEARENIYEFLQKKYHFTRDICEELVNDVENQIATINSSGIETTETIVQPDSVEFSFVPHSERVYQFGGKIFSVSYESERLEQWLHPMLVHLEAKNKSAISFQYELLNFNGKVVFREGKNGTGLLFENKSLHLADQILLHIANKLFDKSQNDWLMTVHASAVTNRKKTVIFTAASGSGKTTLAALLLHKGYELVADDLVLIDKHQRAYGFPSALSVKQGAVKALQTIYPELGEKEKIQLSPDKQVRYLATDSFKNPKVEVYPVREVVFVDYNPKIDFKLTELSCFEGIQAFLEQADISSEAMYAQAFLDWACAASFYRLSYNNKDLAMDAITKIFENEQ